MFSEDLTIIQDITKYCNNLRQISCHFNEFNNEFIEKFGHKLKSFKVNDEINDWNRLTPFVNIGSLELSIRRLPPHLVF